jgi:IPT/TIG domain-containing protein
MKRPLQSPDPGQWSSVRWIAAVALLLPLASCDTGPAASLYDPDVSAAADPAITSVNPVGAALAGVDVIEIAGQNFSANAEENFVYFGENRAQLVAASPALLQVISPPVPAESVGIRVAVLGAENFSGTFGYRLDAAFERFGGFGKIEEPTAVATDPSGNVYMGLFSSGVSAGFETIAPDGARSDFAASTFRWQGLAYGPDSQLYSVRGIRAIFRFEAGGSQQVFKAITPSNVKLSAITFDASGNLWAGGNNTELFRVAPDKSLARFPFEANVTALKTFGSALFAVAETAQGYGVWRFPIDGNGDIAAAENYFDITTALGAGVASEAMAFATDGTLYLGTDSSDPVLVVATDGSSEPLYTGVLTQPEVGGQQIPPSPVLDLEWGPDPFLYVIRARPSGDLGPEADVMIRVNTRKEGFR